MDTLQETLIALARRIAVQVGYPDLENGLQPLERLQAKFAHELQELQDAARAWQDAVVTSPQAEAARDGLYAEMYLEAADCLYYAACCAAQGSDDELEAARALIRRLGMVRRDASRVAAVKYAWRAGGGAKDDTLERRLALCVLGIE